MSFDPEYPFGSADPSLWWQARALPRIVVHPKPPIAPAADGIDDWFLPSSASGVPDDWFVPPPAAAASTGQLAPGAQTTAVNSGSSNPPAPLLDPFTAYWSLIPASRVGAMAWDPPIFPGNPPNNSVTSAWPAAPSLPAAIPNIPTGGLFDGLAKLAPWTPGSGIPLGGMQDALAQLGSSSAAPASSIPTGGIPDTLANLGPPSPDPGSLFPPPAQPQSADAQTVSPVGRRPIADYSSGEILGDAAKSFGVGVGRFGIQSAGLLGDAREMLANSAQQAADYLAPGSAPDAGSKVSDFRASYPLLAGRTSSQLQSAVESYTGPFYQPKTIVGDYAKTAGEFVPGALLMPEGSLALNALRYGLLPALSSETAGQLTQGTAAEPWARTFGAILGAAPSAWRNLPWPRSAPGARPTIEQELAALSERAGQIHGALDKIARSKRATAILSTNGDTVVAGGKRDLDPIQKALIRPGERAAKLRGAHAEITALSEAKNAGLIPRALATSRSICPECRSALEDARGVLTSKFTAIFPR